MTFAISPERSGYDSTRGRVLFQRVEDELGRLPGVTGVTSRMVPLLGGSNWGNGCERDRAFPTGPDIDNNSRFNEVGPGYFQTLGSTDPGGTGVHRGRSRARRRVAIVNEAFAKKFNLDRTRSAGSCPRAAPIQLNIQIVGLVQDAKYSDVKDEIPPLFFLPWRQDGGIGELNFYVRTSLPPAQLLRAIPTLLKRIDPNVPVEELKTMPQQIRENVFLDRMISILSAAVRRRSRRCWPGWASTACSPIRSSSVPGRSACGWRWAPTPGPCGHGDAADGGDDAHRRA